jgi:3-hydroxyisobutyrate dehydrogenase
MIGGDPSVIEKARPAIACFGTKIVHVGDLGAGHAVKAISNTMMAVNVWTASEGLVALLKYGIDPALALEAINGSSGRSNATERLLPNPVLKREFPPLFKLTLLAKDVKIATTLTRSLGVTTPVMSLMSEILSASKATLGQDADYMEILKAVERWSGMKP